MRDIWLCVLGAVIRDSRGFRRGRPGTEPASAGLCRISRGRSHLRPDDERRRQVLTVIVDGLRWSDETQGVPLHEPARFRSWGKLPAESQPVAAREVER